MWAGMLVPQQVAVGEQTGVLTKLKGGLWVEDVGEEQMERTVVG
jgi:hypothetical protein